jgi:subtilase family serine protease
VGLVRPDTTEGLEAPMFAVIENNGTGDTVGKVVTGIYVAGKLYAQKSIGGLLSGEQHCLAFDWRAVSGEVDFVAWVDQAGTINETTHDNDRLHTLVTTGYPDLSVPNITWSPRWDLENSVSLFVEIQNDGAATARPSSVALAADAGVLGTIQLDAMAAGSRTVLCWKWALEPGNHTFSAAVDMTDEILESNENNNRMVRELPSGTRGEPPVPVNLRLSNLSYLQSQWSMTGRQIPASAMPSCS